METVEENHEVDEYTAVDTKELPIVEDKHNILHSKVDNLKSNINELNTDVTSIKQNVTFLNTRISAVESPVLVAEAVAPAKQGDLNATDTEPSMDILNFM